MLRNLLIHSIRSTARRPTSKKSNVRSSKLKKLIIVLRTSRLEPEWAKAIKNYLKIKKWTLVAFLNKKQKPPPHTYPDLSFANSKVQKLLLKEKEKKKKRNVSNVPTIKKTRRPPVTYHFANSKLRSRS
jgi:hypothetical protein